MLDAHQKLLDSKEFNEWRKKHEKSFLAHIFEAAPGSYQAGYSDAKGEKITTFFIEEDSVKMAPQEEAFKKPGTKITPLDISKVKISFEDALAKASSVQEEDYPAHAVMKRIALLQHLDCGQVYNFTFVTQTFKTLNIRIDAATGEVVSHKIISFFDFAK